MALLDFLKRKRSISKASKGKKEVKKPVKKAEKISATEKETVAVMPVTKTKAGKFAYEVVKQPHISEKATYLSEKDQYVFEVLPNYSKDEIKKTLEGIYGVDVLSVNIIKVPAKKRRLGRTEGFRKGYKKAVVKIKQGQKIEIL